MVMNDTTSPFGAMSHIASELLSENPEKNQTDETSDKSSAKNAKVKSDYRTVFISDVHIGTKDCKADQLFDFLKNHSFDQLYLVGDIFDGWKMKSGVYWHKSFNKLIRRVLKLSKKGIPVYYVTGNHDEFLRKWANTQFDNIHLVNRISHTTATGDKYLVIHGDQFESVTHCSDLLRFIGDKGYEVLMFLNRVYNRVRAKYGYGYWSFAAYLKEHIKTAKSYILRYEQAVAHGAKKQGFDGVICGHIHQAAKKEIEGIQYLNTGDWVESCTAILETHDGEMLLIDWLNERKKIKQHKKSTSPSNENELPDEIDVIEA